MTFQLGTDEATELTDAQIRWQCKMYIAALRIADDFGCDAIGIQYQQGLKDLVPASDLVEGLLNNVDRPPVTSRDGQRVLFEGQALPHFNEVGRGRGRRRAASPTASGARWASTRPPRCTTCAGARTTTDDFVWVFEISGSVPPSHFDDGYAERGRLAAGPDVLPGRRRHDQGRRQAGRDRLVAASTSTDGALHIDIGRGDAVELPDEETERRWQATNPEWPIMHAVLHGVTRDQIMARHKANHVQVAYAPEPTTRRRGPRRQGRSLRRARRRSAPVRRCVAIAVNPGHIGRARAMPPWDNVAATRGLAGWRGRDDAEITRPCAAP